MPTQSFTHTSQPLRYFILYGFVGGKTHSRKFRKLLAARGLQPAGSAELADIIVAHSAGCFMIPEATSARLIMLVGLPLQQQKTITTFLRAHRENIRAFAENRHIGRFMRIWTYSLYYGLRQPRRNYRAARMVGRTTLSIPNAEKTHVVLIANRHDPWLKAPLLDEYMAKQPFSFISLAGSHDNIWELGYALNTTNN
ncbi:MAG TPA: hypothetical protein VGG13_02630 [Candidatus Saccharimonadales bacterium]|jgi:hypothetical protein